MDVDELRDLITKELHKTDFPQNWHKWCVGFFAREQLQIRLMKRITQARTDLSMIESTKLFIQSYTHMLNRFQEVFREPATGKVTNCFTARQR